MNRPRLQRLDRALADLQARLAPPAPLVLYTLPDGTLRAYPDGPEYADLAAYRRAHNNLEPMVILSTGPRHEAGAVA